MGVLSFHETKSIISGEGGALLLNDRHFIRRAEIVREKGTNRAEFFRGETGKYTWLDIGSSYPMSDLLAAFLLGQLESADGIIARRRRIWQRYHAALEAPEREGKVRRPVVPAEARHNAHIYHLLFPTGGQRDHFIALMKERGLMSVFHYVPLHGSPAGLKYGRVSGSMECTESVAARIARLPLWPGMEDRMEDVLKAVLGSIDESALREGRAYARR